MLDGGVDGGVDGRCAYRHRRREDGNLRVLTKICILTMWCMKIDGDVVVDGVQDAESVQSGW